MNDPIWFRLAAFAGVFILCTIWERQLPRRPLVLDKRFRWVNNLSLVTLNSALMALLLPIAAIQAAQIAEQQQWGLWQNVALPFWLTTLLAVLCLDLVIYWQHRLFHRLPLLWRLHRVHHADLDIDVTTGLRFHPLEILLSMLIKIVAIWLLGANVLAVIIFEIVLNGSAMFNHSNARLSLALDRKLRQWVVTPDMHRVHHSVLTVETHSNFGFCLSIWDRLFNSYRAQPQKGHLDMKIGVPQIRDQGEQRLDKMLTQPFRIGVK